MHFTEFQFIVTYFYLQAIVLKLLKHFPQQALWMMIAISKVTLQCSYLLAIHDVIVSEVVTKAI